MRLGGRGPLEARMTDAPDAGDVVDTTATGTAPNPGTLNVGGREP